jgi:hypothetical protein
MQAKPLAAGMNLAYGGALQATRRGVGDGAHGTHGNEDLTEVGFAASPGDAAPGKTNGLSRGGRQGGPKPNCPATLPGPPTPVLKTEKRDPFRAQNFLLATFFALLCESTCVRSCRSPQATGHGQHL